MDTPPAGALDRIREEIDTIDDAMLAFSPSASPRSRRSSGSRPRAGPLRNRRSGRRARRRSCAGSSEAKPDSVPAELRVRLWRAIISASTLMQAPVRIHLGTGLFDSVAARLMLRDHFGTTPLAEHPGETQALTALAGHPGDVAVVALDSPWLDPYLDGRAGQARIIASLPQVASNAIPKMLVFGSAAPEPTGDDETLLVTSGQLPRDFRPGAALADAIGQPASCVPAGFLVGNQPAADRPRALQCAACAHRAWPLPKPDRG